MSKASKLYSHGKTKFNYTTYYLNSTFYYLGHTIRRPCHHGLKSYKGWGEKGQRDRRPEDAPLRSVVQVKHKFGSTGCRQRGTMGLPVDCHWIKNLHNFWGFSVDFLGEALLFKTKQNTFFLLKYYVFLRLP